jgi:site-specific recombinase XerD
MDIQKETKRITKHFRIYLEEKRYSPKTIVWYVNAIKTYFLANPGMKRYTYKDVLKSLERYTNAPTKLNTKKGYLNAIKKYYDYLLDTGQREDHPCTFLNLKGNTKRKVVHSDLFTSQELELLLTREERFQKQKLKNMTLASLLIYQGAMPNEIAKLKISDIDMDAGTVFLSGGRVLASRTLSLQLNQYEIIDQYLRVARRKMLKQSSDYLVINYQGKPSSVDDINFLIETFKGLFPDRNLNCKTIRDSVIANWLNEQNLPLDQVQIMAGLRWISSAERYVQANIKEQREILTKVHPLG